MIVLPVLIFWQTSWTLEFIWKFSYVHYFCFWFPDVYIKMQFKTDLWVGSLPFQTQMVHLHLLFRHAKWNTFLSCIVTILCSLWLIKCGNTMTLLFKIEHLCSINQLKKNKLVYLFYSCCFTAFLSAEILPRKKVVSLPCSSSMHSDLA